MKLGQTFEQLAEEDFLNRFPGSLVLGRNVRFKVSEIDRVFLHERTLHFVEVRGRSLHNRSASIDFETPRPESLFSSAKQFRLRKAIKCYLQKQIEGCRRTRMQKPKCNSIQIWLAVVFQDSTNQQCTIQWFKSDQ